MMTGIERVQELGLNTREELGLVNGHRCGFKFTGSGRDRVWGGPGPGRGLGAESAYYDALALEASDHYCGRLTNSGLSMSSLALRP
jgi:hypothetical protein